MLNWHTITRSVDQKFFVIGTELSVALFGPNKRFAVYETRVYRGPEQYDREYIVRDADAIGDDELRAGKRPPIVGRTDDYDKLLAFVAKNNAAQPNMSTEKPPHPLVVDQQTGLCRLATDADIRRMERICAAYDRLIGDLREKLEMANELEKIING